MIQGAEPASQTGRQTGRQAAHLLTEDQLVVKQEEDSLLAASVRLVDPRQLPGVDQF